MSVLDPWLMERLGALGEIMDPAEDRFYVVFQPPVSRAVEIVSGPGGLGLRELYVERYEPLTMWSSMGTRYENLTSREALELARSIREDVAR